MLAPLCEIAAVALAAATLPSPLETGGDGGDPGTGSGAGAERRPPDGVLEPGASEGIPPSLASLLVLLVAVALAWHLPGHRREVVTWLAVGAVVFLVLFLVSELLPAIAEPEIVPLEEHPPDDDALPGSGDGDHAGPGEPGCPRARRRRSVRDRRGAGDGGTRERRLLWVRR